MTHKCLGIHHITAIASAPQPNYDFYTKMLGLRLVKRSVNQDQTEAYHLFYGDRLGEPGMDLTFFTFDPVYPGISGSGSVSLISLAVPEDSLEFWLHRFNKHQIKHDSITQHFGYPRIVFFDPDDQKLELVGLSPKDYKFATKEVWQTKEITNLNAITAFHSARLSVLNRSSIEPIITDLLGFELIDQEKDTSLLNLTTANRARFIEIQELPDQQPSLSGAGSVHHIAFQVKDQTHLISMRQSVLEFGLHPTPVIDRFYFKSVYFQTPAGILFELATNEPGFTVDEPESELGSELHLPPWLEPDRDQIQKLLPPLTTS